MLDPRPREEMNHMVMDAMTTTSRRYWILVMCPGVGRCCLLVWRMGQHDRDRHRIVGRTPPESLGHLYRHLCLLDRHQPCRHICLGDFARVQSGIPPPIHPRRRADDHFWPGCRRPVAADPSRPGVGLLLDDPIPERALVVAQLPFTACVGFPGDHHLPVEQHDLPLFASDPRRGNGA